MHKLNSNLQHYLQPLFLNQLKIFLKYFEYDLFFNQLKTISTILKFVIIYLIMY